ncbi:MAG TPA: aminotransferase class I/II-fold pyridoxal phosphate-dependent enzyme [Vicinamibacterales bacterium]|nr:aminotransferase class I/II-fold pyridoxal phosphate-dependent enzyme [Vicinamibacterales bacterium]
MQAKQPGINSRLVHGTYRPDATGAVNVPIYQSSTFAFRNAEHGAALFAGREKGYIYTRIGNPTIGAFEDAVASIENGAGGVATSSGLEAVNTVYMTVLGQGAHLVSTASVYGPSRGLVEKHYRRYGVEADFVDTSDLDNLKRAMRPETRLVYVESPSNPAMQVTDIAGAAAIAHDHGALLAVDNTFASPYLQRPLDLGADIALHSITKFINGHADVVGGVIVAGDAGLLARLRDVMVQTGCSMDPHQAFLVLRGLKTLGLRVERAQANAMAIARWLEAHPMVASVRYIGLPSHPQHELARRQMSGFGSMISFELKGGLEAGRRLMDRVRLATLAVSLGGVETLIEHPASMTHASMSKEARDAAGFTDGLVRYAVGIEDVEDLIADLDQALSG